MKCRIIRASYGGRKNTARARFSCRSNSRRDAGARLPLLRVKALGNNKNKMYILFVRREESVGHAQRRLFDALTGRMISIKFRFPQDISQRPARNIQAGLNLSLVSFPWIPAPRNYSRNYGADRGKELFARGTPPSPRPVMEFPRDPREKVFPADRSINLTRPRKYYSRPAGPRGGSITAVPGFEFSLNNRSVSRGGEIDGNAVRKTEGLRGAHAR